MPDLIGCTAGRVTNGADDITRVLDVSGSALGYSVFLVRSGFRFFPCCFSFSVINKLSARSISFASESSGKSSRERSKVSICSSFAKNLIS